MARGRHDHGVVLARPLADASVRSVAIVRLRVGLGDLLASVPALRAIRRARPDLHVALVTWDEMRPIVERMRAYVDELIPFPGYPGIPERPVRRDLLPGFFEQVRGRRFDLALQMYGAQPAANGVAERMGARVVGGFFTPGLWEADLATHLPYPQSAHEIHRHLMLVEFLGVPWHTDELEFPLRPEDDHERDRLLEQHGLEAGEYVCVHPGATAASRRWLPQRFAALADSLSAEGWKIVLTGVTEERPLVARVAASMRAPAVDVCGRTTLGGFAALLSTAALLVVNESGPAQVAAALGVPSVALFFAGDPSRWRGLDGERHRVATAGAPCQPCGHLNCPIDFRCARDLEVEQVLGEASRLLARAQR